MKNIIIPSHPLLAHNLAILRDKTSTRDAFLNAFQKAASLLIQEGYKFLPTKEQEIETPLTKTTVQKIDEEYTYIIAPILRAGLAFTEPAVSFLPQAHVLHIGMYRDEKTKEPVWYYDKTPTKFPKKTKVFILDPMLATGGSAVATINLFKKKGIFEKDIIFISLLSAPEGIKAVQKEFPNIKIITASIDKFLNDNAYIVPGLGDAGDRFFNSIIY